VGGVVIREMFERSVAEQRRQAEEQRRIDEQKRREAEAKLRTMQEQARQEAALAARTSAAQALSPEEAALIGAEVVRELRTEMNFQAASLVSGVAAQPGDVVARARQEIREEIERRMRKRNPETQGPQIPGAPSTRTES
jgi:hypothetical protein